jgi:hypothetical protein
MCYRGPDGHCVGHLYIYIYCTMFRGTWSLLTTSCTVLGGTWDMPFRLLIGFITISHLQTLIIISYAVSHLHSLQSYTSIFHSWRLHIHFGINCNCMPPHSLRNFVKLNCSSQSQSHIATDGQSVSTSWCRAPSGAHDQIFIAVWQLRTCFCGAPSLTRRRVCLLYMLLALASAVFLGSESLGTRDHIFLSQTWDFHFRRLLRLAGSRWRYSTPPPHGFLISKLNC